MDPLAVATPPATRLPSEISAMLLEVERLDSFSSQTSLDDLETKLVLARCYIKALKNSQHGINALAPEILGKIFSFLDTLRDMGESREGELHHSSAQKLREMRTIMHVCRHWRSVALGNPSLWNHIHLDHALHPFALLSLAMSGSMTLTVYYTDSKKPAPANRSDKCNDGVRALSDHLHRLEKLVMFIQWQTDSPNWGFLKVSEAPDLRNLQVIPLNVYQDSFGVLPLVFAGQSRHSKLQEVLLCLYTPSPEAQFKNLRSLVLQEQVDIPDPNPGFCRFLPLIAESPQLEELIIDRHGSSGNFVRNTDRSPSPPILLPRLQTLSLALGSSWRADSTEDLAEFLSCIQIPDTASRFLFTRDRVEWDVSMHDLMTLGSAKYSGPRLVRKLQLVSNKDLEWWKAFALEGDTLTVTTNVDARVCSTLFASGILCDVEDLVLVQLPQYPSLQEYEVLFQSLPSLRHISLSGPTRGSILVPRVTNALGLRPSKYTTGSQNALPVPLLESISFLYYEPGRLPQTEDDDSQVDGTMIALLAEERERHGSQLQRVVVERCREDHLGWIHQHVVSAVSIKRWEGYPGDYHEKGILKEMLVKGGTGASGEADRYDANPNPHSGGRYRRGTQAGPLYPNIIFMPPRLNKRQQRELEELEALGGKPEDTVEGDKEIEDEPVPIAKKAAGGFAALMAGNDEESEDDEVDQTKPSKSRKNKKKKKKPASEVSRPEVVESPKPVHTPKSTPAVPISKKALKRAKAKEKKAADDELDQALAELSLKYQNSHSMHQTTVTGQSFADLLSVSVQHLDSEAEMRKFFGAKVVQANREGSSAAGPSRRKTPAVRSQLTQPKPTWWAAKGREGLSIRSLSEDEADAKLKRHGWQLMAQEKWWTVEYSKRYKSLTKVFMSTVYSGDPQGFWDLLGRSPWQADTLLQVSEVYRHREEYAQAFDFVDRALFTYERAFVGAFNFTSGANRLDFDFVENRPFYLAVHRQVADLLRRGCVRTSFEFAKLLYSLDPWSDPHGALLHLDFLAIKSGMSQWLVDVFGLFKENKADAKRINPSVLPGWAYARALALRSVEDYEKLDHTKSTAALRDALSDFPSVVPLLADKLDLAIPASIRSHPDFKIETGAVGLKPAHSMLHLLSHLYAQKSHVLWQDHAQWFLETVSSTFSDLPSRLPVTERRQAFLALYENPEPRYSAYRFLLVMETTHRNLFPFIDINLEQARGLMCDPLPPPTTVNKYDPEYFRNVEDLVSFTHRTRREQAMDQRRLAQMVPDANFRRQLEGFFNGNPNFAERFPGGILQFAQAIAQLPPDALEDMMMAQAMGDGGVEIAGLAGAGGMPGGLDIEDLNPRQPVALGVQQAPPQVNLDLMEDQQDEEEPGEEEGVDDEDEDDEEEISPMPRVLRNIIGRFWGRAPVEEESSTDEEERELLDNNGVD